MSYIKFTKAAAPATPAANKATIYVDTADRKPKVIDDNGVISALVNDGLKDRNILTNGGMSIRQRVPAAVTAIVGASTTTRAGVVCDRWAVTTGNTTTTLYTHVDTGAAVETGLETKYYSKITQNTNAAKFIFSQFLANEDMANVRGKKVRLSCKVKQFAGSNAVYRLGLLQLTAAGTIDVCPTFISAIGADSVEPTWGTNLAAITPDASPTGENGTITGVALSITSTAAWVRSSCVFTVPVDAKNLCVVLYRNTIGAASDAVGIAEMRMTMGTEIIDWKDTPLSEDLEKCQRYFYKTFAYATVPAQSLGVTTGCIKWSAGVAGAVAGTWNYHAFPVPMWKAPTITLFNPAAANAQVRQIGATAGDCTSSSGAEITDRGCGVTCTPGASAVVGTILGVHLTAEAEFVA
jgi:hypothetical protein